MKLSPILLFPLIFVFLSTALYPGAASIRIGTHPQSGARTFSVFSVNADKTGTELNGIPFKVVGIRVSNALISDVETQELIDNLDTFRSYGINTVSVFFQGSRFGAVKGYNEDATLNPIYANRMKQIIEEADKRKMVVLVGGLYYNAGSEAIWTSWTQTQANEAIANTVEWLKANNFRNVFLDVDNEGEAHIRFGFAPDKLIAAGKAVDPGYVMGAGGSVLAENADVALHMNAKAGTVATPGKPYIESEGFPRAGFSASGYTSCSSLGEYNYWGSWSRSATEPDNYINVGVYTSNMQCDFTRLASWYLNNGKGYMGASTWLQAVPPKGPNQFPGGMGTSSDPGIRFWLEHVKSVVGPYDPDPISTPTLTAIVTPTNPPVSHTPTPPPFFIIFLPLISP